MFAVSQGTFAIRSKTTTMLYILLESLAANQWPRAAGKLLVCVELRVKNTFACGHRLRGHNIDRAIWLHTENQPFSRNINDAKWTQYTLLYA